MKRIHVYLTKEEGIMLLELLNRKIEDLDKIDYDSGELITDQIDRIAKYISLYRTFEAVIDCAD